MNRRWLWAIGAGILLCVLGGNAQPVVQDSSSGNMSGAALLDQYCVTCHNMETATAGLALDTMSVDRVEEHAAAWERVVRKIRTGMMPPSGAPRPARPVLDRFAGELEDRLDAAAAGQPNPGNSVLRRLNRTEYGNAIRDLLAVDIDVATLLPADDSSEGFDNIAEALGVSPSLVQGHISSAMKLSRLAVGDRTALPTRVTYLAPPGLSHDTHLDGMPLGTRGGMTISHTFPLDAEYDLSIGGNAAGAAMDITLDGEKVQVASPRNFRIAVSAGPHTIVATLVDQRRGAGVDDAYSDFRVDSEFQPGGAIQSIAVTGPFNAAGPGGTPSRRQIYVCYPENAEGETPCARQIVSELSRRAFRRPVAGMEIDGLMQFYEKGRAAGDFETGIQHAVARVLVDPRFLFRAEADPSGIAPGEVYRVSDLELASRLSFFLWSTIPDDELLQVAAEGRLHEPEVLAAQTRRMLADPKSAALIENFAGQWLYLRDLAGAEREAEGFDENLRKAMRDETEMLFDSVVREDRSVVTLLDSDYTFLNERLAEHYGITGIRGSYMRRVTLPEGNPRRGLLGHGSILTVTSVANRTSPVSRGKWILENILGTPAPVPPPGVETNLDEDPAETRPRSLRERLELHRANPTCSSCHRIMDPIGLSLENFNLVGKWRDEDGGVAIDASGELVDGTPLHGPVDLRQALLGRSDEFVTTVIEKLMTYAIGRGIQYHDMPTVRAIRRKAALNDNRFSTIVLGIVESVPFQMRIKSSE